MSDVDFRAILKRNLADMRAIDFCTGVPLPEGPDAPTLAEVLESLSWATTLLSMRESTWEPAGPAETAFEKARTLLAAFKPVEPVEPEERRSAIGWLSHPEFEGVCVTDPDGWDRQNFDASWDEEITRAEFERRLARSTSIRQPVEPVQEDE